MAGTSTRSSQRPRPAAAQVNGTGRTRPGRRRREGVFLDLDRTLLAGASGLVLSTAMRAEGLFEGRVSLPGERIFYGVYEAVGESLPFMAMVRAAVRFVRGWPADSVRRAGEVAAPQLLELLQPYAPAVLAEHREAGRRLVLATTSPLDLVAPFARMLGVDDVVATRYEEVDGRYTGRIDGEFVWGVGKLAAVRRFADQHGVDLDASYAYSDSVFDVPLLSSVGHPVAVQPDPSLRLVAALARWPIAHWDRPPGVAKVAGLEAYHLLRPFVRPESFPYARFDIAGVERIPARGPVLLAANHRSYFDVVALALVAATAGRPVRFLGKKELFDAPLIGPLARSLGGICVDRAGEPAHALAEARRVLQAGEPVLILPQGTIPRGRAFFDPELRGKTGVARLAADTGAPVVPIGGWGTEQVWPRSARLPTVTTVLHPPTVRVRVGAPIDVAEAARRDPVAATGLVMSAISAELPLAARARHEPSAEELARAVPPGHRAE
jgi:putative phosphoserine phosphatase/1-acylglycerol-3-phosphate O-acyltransferase